RRYLEGHRYCEGRVLDVGSGTGFLLDLCSIQPEWYLGVDVSDQMIEVARHKHPRYEFRKGNLERLGEVARPSYYDNALYLFGTYSYALDQKAALDQLAAVLRPGGRFFIMALSHRYPHRASYSVAQAGY